MDAAVETSTRVAVVGLGKMGLPIAERILAAGYPLAVFNRSTERASSLVEQGATLLASPRDALTAAEVCVTMLADDGALEAVVLGDDGLLAGARPGTVLIDMSTVSVAISERVAEQAANVDVHYLRTPVSGNPTVVRSGNLTLIVSGPEDIATDVDRLLRAIGPKVFYVGEGERARVVKLALQILIGGTAELLGEALLLGERAGIDRAKLLEVIGASAVGSPFVAYKSEPLLRDDYSATFTIAMLLKDVELVRGLAATTGVEPPFTEELAILSEAAIEHGYGDMDLMALFLQLRDRSTPQSTTRSR